MWREKNKALSSTEIDLLDSDIRLDKTNYDVDVISGRIDNRLSTNCTFTFPSRPYPYAIWDVELIIENNYDIDWINMNMNMYIDLKLKTYAEREPYTLKINNVFAELLNKQISISDDKIVIPIAIFHLMYGEELFVIPKYNWYGYINLSAKSLLSSLQFSIRYKYHKIHAKPTRDQLHSKNCSLFEFYPNFTKYNDALKIQCRMYWYNNHFFRRVLMILISFSNESQLVSSHINKITLKNKFYGIHREYHAILGEITEINNCNTTWFAIPLSETQFDSYEKLLKYGSSNIDSANMDTTELYIEGDDYSSYKISITYCVSYITQASNIV